MYSSKKYFFCGIAGSGMSSLAQILVHKNCRVMGSDRSFDQNKNLDTFRCLTEQGIELFPQNGEGVVPGIDRFIVSTAVEPGVPDVKAAIRHRIKIQKRSELLAEFLHRGKGIAVGGTNGKSTVTGMVGHILKANGLNPTVINGGVMINALEAQPKGLGNVWQGGDDICVIEADESDGSIDLYIPSVAVAANITLDHKPLVELRKLLSDFLKRAHDGAVINLDCPETAKFCRINKVTVTFGIENPQAQMNAVGIKHLSGGVKFKVNDVEVELSVPGRHNVSNALAAMAVGELLGINRAHSASALKSFKGIRRRLEFLGSAGGVTVIDDFAHNPAKITASLAALKEYPGRLVVMFQPHGFGPARFLRTGLVESFINGLDEDDILLMPEIFYPGGTVTRDISSADIVDDVNAGGRNAHFFTTRKEIGNYLLKNVREGDRVVVMGARDDTLTMFARDFLRKVK